jgi:hypothetical protein
MPELSIHAANSGLFTRCLPEPYGSISYSYDQLLGGLFFLGNDYKNL